MTADSEPRTADGGQRTADQISAREKHACPACGAQAEWNPAKQLLICPFCGTESPDEGHKQGGVVEELDLLAMLRSLPDEARGDSGRPRKTRVGSNLPGL